MVSMVNKTLVCTVLLLAPLFGAASTVITRENQSNAARFDAYGVPKSTCNAVFPEPKVPTKLPSWATVSAAKLAKDKSVRTVSSVGAFRKGEAIVIKKCTSKSLRDVVAHVKPYPNRGTANIVMDIYFDCGKATTTHVIGVKKELEFGTPAQNTKGTFRLIAPDRNVELNGEFRTRIMKVHRYAHVTLYGITFKNGKMVNMHIEMKDIPTGGYSGAGLLVSFWATAVVYKCEFIHNLSRSKFVRFASGGAIMAETGSKLYIWGSYFKSNHGTNGGAIASSSAQIVYVVQSTFYGNVAHGGYDMSKSKTVNGVTKPVLQIRGGAMRNDSVKGHSNGDPHIFVCNTKFEKNRLSMSDADLKFFGYKANEAGYLFAGASAFALWNKSGALNLSKGDHNLLTMRGCDFDANIERLPWKDDRAGRYTFEARGAGHIDILDCFFARNLVQKAVCGLDNSDFFKGYEYDLKMQNINFENNGRIPPVRFAPKKHTRCDVRNVGGMYDGSGDCIKLMISSAKDGGSEVTFN